MPRIPYANEGQEAAGATPFYQELKTSFGMVPNLVKLVVTRARRPRGSAPCCRSTSLSSRCR